MNALVKHLGKTALRLLPDHPLVYRFCQRYVDRYRGENNGDMTTNGELRFLQQLLPQCRTVFDVGANVGQWARLALSINPQLDLHCFEPSRPTFERLQSVGLPANVACNNFGLGAAAEETTLFVFGDGCGTNSLYQRDGLEDWGLAPNTGQETIRLETLANYCRQRNIPAIDLVKLDIEGHELAALRGMSDWLAAGRIGALQLEYGGCNIDARVFFKDIWDFFMRLPYSFYKIHPCALQKTETYSQALDNFQHQNWAVLRHGAFRVRERGLRCA
jgi:FkbM family methyltransferase